ncbi:hypothetical protein BC941DRAFT_192044 [Chlamydoabsidia padenii]|nr:hypothetical protein BC941DRAFT_192044 [Chlamydoabsidia padenii]
MASFFVLVFFSLFHHPIYHAQCWRRQTSTGCHIHYSGYFFFAHIYDQKTRNVKDFAVTYGSTPEQAFILKMESGKKRPFVDVV